MRRTSTVAAVVMMVMGAACSSASRTTAPTPTTTRAPRTGSSRPRFDIVLDDHGLELPPGPTPAGIYRVSFEDQRSHPTAGQHAQVRFRPTGPDIVLDEVPAGHSADVTFLPNLEAYVVIDDEAFRVPVVHELDIRPTPGYSTPVT